MNEDELEEEIEFIKETCGGFNYYNPAWINCISDQSCVDTKSTCQEHFQFHIHFANGYSEDSPLFKDPDECNKALERLVKIMHECARGIRK